MAKITYAINVSCSLKGDFQIVLRGGIMYVHCVSSFTVRPVALIVPPLYHFKLIIFYMELLSSRLFTADLLFINILLFSGVCRHWYKHLHADLALSYISAVNSKEICNRAITVLLHRRIKFYAWKKQRSACDASRRYLGHVPVEFQ